MPHYAIKEGQRVIRVDMADAPPEEAHALLEPWAGIPAGGAAGRELREANGALYWQTVDTAATWAAIRTRRDALLSACDWITVRAIEQGQPVPTAWATYRQALRDITAQSDPFSISWPTAPV